MSQQHADDFEYTVFATNVGSATGNENPKQRVQFTMSTCTQVSLKDLASNSTAFPVFVYHIV